MCMLTFKRQVASCWELYSDEDRDKPTITAFVYILETTIDLSTKFAIISRKSITDDYLRCFGSKEKFFRLKY